MENLTIEVAQCDAEQTTPSQQTSVIPTVTEIETNLLMQNGCSSSTPENDLCYEVNELKITKKKTRRKPRQKKVNVKVTREVPEDVTEEQTATKMNSLPDYFNFKIRAISSQTTGKVFRVKNGICCKHINLNFLRRFQGNGTEVYGVPRTPRPNPSKVIVTNDSFHKDNSKSTAQNGTTLEPYRISQVDQSNLQSSGSTNLQGVSGSSSPKRKQRLIKQRKQKSFIPHWSYAEVQTGLQTGQLVKGVIRINAKNFREAYVSNEDRSQHDYCIQSIADRNRALEGDVVAIKIKPKNEWTEKQKTALVVFILEKIHTRTAVGFLHLMHDKNRHFAAFTPRDLRVPKIKIPANVCPLSFHQHPHRYESMLFRARIISWKDIKNPIGTIIENVGVMGELESETAALLAEHNLDVTPFPQELLKFVSFTDTIPEKEFDYRLDLRKECIFTIDPLTARDLDDAVSCKPLENGNFEIGVHISDVGFYLKQGTPLDRMVCRKGTTIYLVSNVYHMLPKELCLHCSLLPGADKLAFSVFWEMTKSGEIISHRFSRTIINSCVQLAYEHAQTMIEDPNREFEDGELPDIFGGYTHKDLSKTVNYLQEIAVNLRAQRFESGALRINQTKLLFKVDEESGEPSEYFVYENKDSHRLIEEFMLLANISVAQKIVEDFPNLAFLRCHDAPNQRLLVDVQKKLKLFNIDLDISSSKEIQRSMQNIEEKNNLGNIQMSVLSHLLAKPMTRARYFCAGDTESEEDYKHYALHVPIYTHFTSPIRRYADIMVHRLLSASLGYGDTFQWNETYVADVANNCNVQKYNAKLAGEASSDVYLTHYIADHQPFVQCAIVIDVKNSSFDIIVPATGSVIRMYPNALGDDVQCVQDEQESGRRFRVVFPATAEHVEEGYIIQLFSILQVSLHRKPKTNKLEARLLRPISSQSFVRQNSNL